MRYDAIVIGGGVIGCATAMELGRYTLKAAVLEAGEDVCTGTSKANSAIVHAGFDAEPGSLKARFNVEGSRRMPELCKRLDIPYKRCGALVLSFSEEDRPRLEELLHRGEQNGVDVCLLERDELRRLEPHVSEEAAAALYAPGSAIVCPFELCFAMAENAARNGVDFHFDCPVENITAIPGGGWRLETPKGIFEAEVVINAAGVCGGELHNMVSNEKVTIVPRKGEYCLLDKKAGDTVRHTVFQLPTAMGKGVLVTPTVHGNILIGPTAEDIDDPEGTDTTAPGLETVLRRGKQSVPGLPASRVITSFAGLRAHPEGTESDFIIGEASGAFGFLDAIGMESPGLSSSPAVGEFLAESAAYLLRAGEKKDWKSDRDPVLRPAEMTEEERAELIFDQPAYGNMICRCELISEGEIVDAIHRVPGARSLDGVKRRVRAGAGRCQGGFCMPRVQEILARELGIPQEEVTKSGGKSRNLTGKLREGGNEQ